MNKLSRYNDVRLGLVIGLVVPAVTVLVFYLVRFGHLSIGEFLNTMKTTRVLSSILSLCAIPNLLVFFIFIWTNMLYLARGVLMATFVFAAVVVAVKYLI
jgi:hypothetical protein